MNETTPLAPADLAGTVPSDAVAAAPGALDQALALIQAGGPVVVILLVFSVVALAVFIMKLLQFQSARLWDRRFVEPVLTQARNGRLAEALAALRGSRSPVAEIMAVAIDGFRHRIAEDRIREEVARIGSARLEELRSYLRVIEVIATLSPLLGLFGTVLGMIDAFRQMEAAGSNVNPAILSGGIWVALLTTAVGLAVAIPAVAMLNWLERIVERAAHMMDDAVTRLFTMPQQAAGLPSGQISGQQEREAMGLRQPHAHPAE